MLNNNIKLIKKIKKDTFYKKEYQNKIKVLKKFQGICNFT